MLLTIDEQDLLDFIQEQLEPDTIKGAIDLSDSRFKSFEPDQREAIFQKLKRSGRITTYSTTDALHYEVEMHPDFLIEPV